MNFSNITFLTCSYNQKQILEFALKSIVFHHPNNKIKLLVIENSDTNEICDWLAENNISFWKNDTGKTTHSPSVALGLGLIETKYCVLFDTDIIVQKPLEKLFDLFEKNNLTLAGELQGSRGGYNLFDRISPHFCLINMHNIDLNDIVFHDQKRIDYTGSQGFFNHIPLQNNDGKKYYDCGGTFLEDVRKNGLKVANLSGLKDYIYTCESLSWSEQSKVDGYIELGKQRRKEFMEKAIKYKDVDLKNKFER
jgi:hypothetical protein